MPRVSLLGGAYQAQSIIANAQACINLYQESNPQGNAPTPITHYLTPGLDLLTPGPVNYPVRRLYRSSNGQAYAVIGPNVYTVASNWALTQVGTITNLSTPVIFADNGLVVVLVDGTASGWAIDMVTFDFAPITDPSFYGATYADYIDTFLIFNQPGTANMYSSLSEVTFDMLTGTVGAVYGGYVAAAGTGYTPGTYLNVPLTGGTGTGVQATVTVSGTGTSGSIATGSIGSGGSSYTNGTYSAVTLTGGSGTGATANITVAGGIVTVVALVSYGENYVVGDVLTASTLIIGSGSGFVYDVTSINTGVVTAVAITVEGNDYVVGDSLGVGSTLGDGTGFLYQVQNVHGYAFDPTYIAAKSGYPDPLQAVIVMHREIWLIGQLTTEIWYDSGAADFPFQAMPGAFVEHGCIAPYSIAAQDLSVFWLSQDKQGQTIVLEGSSYQARRVSTHAIENTLREYATISDAIGFCYQQNGHVFYVLTFPSADATWVYDKSVGLWHQRAWTDTNGILHRHRANTAMNAYNTVVVGDWQDGNLYEWDLDTYTDAGSPVSRIRSMPHLLENLNRVNYSQLVADMEVGEDTSPADMPVVNLRWSDDRGKTYGNYVQQDLGQTGQYLTNIQWRRLGIARDRVFELSWSANAKTALNGVFVTTTPSAT